MKIPTFVLTLALTALTTVSASAQLHFLFEPASQSASLGADALFLGTAYGFEPATYQWRKNGAPLPGQTFDILYLSALQPADAGDYDVVASSTFGSITSQVATLTVDATFTKVVAGPLVTDGGNSTGSAWGDYDNDGDLDVLVTRNGNDFNALYRNHGDGTFARVETSPVTTDLAVSVGATWADYDNDGWLDLLVINSGNNALSFLYHNNADGTFLRITNGLGADAGTVQTAAWADYDGDGWLDLLAGPVAAGGFFGNGGGLYRNNGGTLTKVTPSPFAGLTTAQSATWTDFDGDGDPDLFCATVPAGGFQSTPGHEVLYRNEGGGAFTRITNGVAVTSGNNSTAASWADSDGDGHLDVFVGNAEGQVKFLFRNHGDGTFTPMTGEIVGEAGATESALWGDYDNDGWIDLFVVNAGGGSFLFHNQGDGTFSQRDVGSPTGDRANSIGGGWVDLDNDGDLDLFVANFGGNNFLYRNNGNSHAWLTVNCVGRTSNRSGVGARVSVLATIGGVARWQVREIAVRDSSGSPATLRAEFGLGDATTITTLRVEWPSGTHEERHHVTPRQFLTLTEPPSILVLPGQASEGDTGTRDLHFTVHLQEPNTNLVSVDFATADGTALAGIDYLATQGTLSFAPGQTNLTIAVPVIGNTLEDTNRIFYLELSNPTNMPISVRRAAGTILNDDPLALTLDNPTVLEGDSGTTSLIFTVSLNKPWHEPVTLDFSTANATATAGQDYVATNGALVFNPGESSKSVAVTVQSEVFNELNELVFLNLNNIIGAVATRRQGSGTIVNDDPLPAVSVTGGARLEGNTGATQLVFVVSLSAPSGRSVSFSYATTNGTAVSPADYIFRSATVTFPIGVASTNIAITVIGDTIPEASETFLFGLYNPVNAGLGTSPATGVILDNDFRVAPLVVHGSGVNLSFYSVSNRLHRIERSFSLAPPVQWTPVAGAESLTGHGGLIQVSDPGAPGEPQRFYRIYLLP